MTNYNFNVALFVWAIIATLYAIGYWWLWSRAQRRYDELNATCTEFLVKDLEP